MKLSPSFVEKWLPASAAGAALAVFYLYILNQQSPISGLSAVLIFLYLWAFFSLAVFVLFDRLITPRLAGYPTTWRWLWLAGCLGAGLWLANNIPLRLAKPLAVPFSPPVIHKLIFLCSAGFAIGLVLFAGSVFFATRRTASETPAAPARFRWVLYALPILLAWLIYLLAYWPGMMSADSLNQWGQVLSGQFNDHHPASHTFIIWLLTRIYPSPALVALAQILALGLLAGYILGYFETHGAPKSVLWAASFIFALSPVNGTMVNTLWKDVLYSTVFVGLTFLIYRIVNSQGKWIVGRWNWILLGSAAAALSLMRHNGWPIVLGTFFLLFLSYHRQWKPFLAAFLLCTALYLGIRGPLFQIFNVKKSNVLFEASTSLYTITTHTDPGSEAEKIIESIRPFSGSWECNILGSIWQAYEDEGDGAEENTIQILENLIQRMPRLMMYSYRCRRSIVWIIYDPYGEMFNPSHAEYWIDDNPYGIEPNSRFPYLREQISEFVKSTSSNINLNWLIWRPALYLYIFLFIIAVQILKFRDIRWFLLGLPILIQSVLSTVILILPNFRYHYAVLLLAMLFWPLLFTPAQETELEGEDITSPSKAQGVEPAVA